MSPSSSGIQQSIYQRPVELLQQLIRFNTTNPPGNEAACITYIADLLRAQDIEPLLIARDPTRPNLIARIAGQGTAPPLLLFGHVDVVTTDHQVWKYPPFDGVVADGYVWGRGALDMKGGVAMLLASFLRAKAEALLPAGDIVLALLTDEEAGGDDGAKYLVEHHAGLFSGIRYALGEFGGFSMSIGGRRFYPIQVAEKQICWMRATLHGPGGHGSLPLHGGAMAKLGHMLQQLDRRRLPVHITPVTRRMIELIAAALPMPRRVVLAQLLKPRRTDRILRLLGPHGAVFDPLLHNTVNVTAVHGGDTINVVPSEIVVSLDGRLLPGLDPGHMHRELRRLVGVDIKLDIVRYDAGPAEPQYGLFETLAAVIREVDPAGIPIPILLPGVTDGRFFSRVGIQSYGFLPMQLPDSLVFWQLVHAADERLPVEAVDFGAEAIYKVLQTYGRV